MEPLPTIDTIPKQPRWFGSRSNNDGHFTGSTLGLAFTIDKREAKMKVCSVASIILCALATVLIALPEGVGAGPERVNAEDAAAIGDVVIIRYTNGTTICEDSTDADKIYIAGESAARESKRIEPYNLKKIVEAMSAARNSAMREATSCQRSPEPRDLRYIVRDKRIVHNRDYDLHVVKYCIKPTNRSDDICWWLDADATTMNGPIVKVPAAKGAP